MSQDKQQEMVSTFVNGLLHKWTFASEFAYCIQVLHYTKNFMAIVNCPIQQVCINALSICLAEFSTSVILPSVSRIINPDGPLYQVCLNLNSITMALVDEFWNLQMAST